MRQTRRSRSTAATPQKDEPTTQVEEEQVPDKSAKANLETVFEKEGDGRDGEGAGGSDDVSTTGSGANEGAEPTAFEEGTSSGGGTESKGAVTDENSDMTNTAATPKKSDTGLIELNCQVCNCSFTNYHEHMNSEGHKSKITPLTKIENQANSDKIQAQGQKRGGDQDGTPAAKRMRNQNQNANSGEKFQCDICKLTLTKQQDYDFHMNGRRHLLNVNKAQGKSYCEICKLFFNTVTDLNDHTESQLHKNTLAERKQDKQVFECALCKVTSIGQRQHDQHLTSKRHKRSQEGATKPPATPAKASAPASASAVNGNKQPNSEKAVIKKWIYFCNACNYGCNQDQPFSSHMILADHKAAVTDMRKKGLVLEKGTAKPLFAKTAVPASTGPAARKFPQNNAARANTGPQNAANKPNTFRGNVNNAGPVTKVTYNIVSGPNVNSGAQAASKPVPLKKDSAQANRKGPASGPVGASGPKKNVPAGPFKPNTAVNKPAMGGRQNPRFSVQSNDMSTNKFVSNQPMKLGFQKLPYDAPGNFTPVFGSASEPNNVGGNYGNYGGRPGGSYGTNMRSDNAGPVGDIRNDFRGNIRDGYQADIRDIRDLRDIRNVDVGAESRAEGTYRAGYYRDLPSDTARDIRADYAGNLRRGDLNMDARSDVRASMGSDMRGMARSDIGRDVGGEIRGYDMRDLRNDSRSDYLRDRGTSVAYGSSAGFGQQSYRGTDDFRYDTQGRSAQAGGQSSATGSYGTGMMGSNRYDSYMDRNSSAYNSQYGGSARGMGYIGDMALNGR